MASQEILAFVLRKLEHGLSKDQVKAAGIEHGWSKEDINGALASIELNNSSILLKPIIDTGPTHLSPARKVVELLPMVIILFSLGSIAYGYYQKVIVPAQQGIAFYPATATTSFKAVGVSGPGLLIPGYSVPPITSKPRYVVRTPLSVVREYAVSNTTVATDFPMQPTPAQTPVAAATPAPTQTTSNTSIDTSSPTLSADSLAEIAANIPVTQDYLTDPDPQPAPTVEPLPDPPVLPAPTPKPVPTPLPTPTPVPEPTSTSTPVTPAPKPLPTPTTTPPVPIPTPTPVPVPTPSPLPNPGRYQTYPGCEQPAATYARTIYINPATGSQTTGNGSSAKPYHTLAEALVDKDILPGDHVILMRGEHGVAFADIGKNPALKNASAWTWFDFQNGATISDIDFRGFGRVLMTNVQAIGGTGELVSFSNSSNIVFADSLIAGALDSSAFTVNDWLTVSRGFGTREVRCVALLRNTIKNVRMGATVYSTKITPAENALNTLIEGNTIRNFSGDGIRPLGSNITVQNNFLYDEYLSAADGDTNHDDGMQVFALGGSVFDNININHNWLQESTDPNRKFNAGMQGISIFDGIATHMSVTYNTVLNSTYHGISLYGVQDSIAANNTVANISNNGRKPRVDIPPTKGGQDPVNSIIKNNAVLAGSVYGSKTGTTLINNYNAATDPSLVFKTFNRTTYTFDVHPKTGGPIDGKGIGSFTTGPVAIVPAQENYSLLASVSAAFGSLGGVLNNFFSYIASHF